MKKSELKNKIKEEITDILEASQGELDSQLDTAKQIKATLDSIDLDEGNDSDKFQDDGYVDKKDVDDTTDLYVHNSGEDMAFESEIKEEEDEPTSSQLKGDSVSKLGTKLQQIAKEMKQVVKKWKDAEGAEKIKLTDELRKLTKIKKEIESLLQ